MKFAHIADTHIKNLKYHYEYRMVFKELYNKLREENVDYIIHCGDIAHTKTQLSPEFVELCSNFLSELASIAPTYLILGNHDGNLKNSSRQDAITPIVEALNNPNLFLLKESGEVNLNGNLIVIIGSMFRPTPTQLILLCIMALFLIVGLTWVGLWSTVKTTCRSLRGMTLRF